MNASKEKQLTLEQLALKYDMTITEVNSSINNTYNKLVESLLTQKFDMWDIVVNLKGFFGMTEKEAVDKLNSKHKLLLKRAALNRTNTLTET